MSIGKEHKASWLGNTLLLAATVGGSGKALRVKMLVDTGASRTILPIQVVEHLGYDLSKSRDKMRLATANGLIVVPLINISWLNCAGQLLKKFPVVAHTIPNAGFDGVIGMDFLIRCKAVISIGDAKIRFEGTRIGN